MTDSCDNCGLKTNNLKPINMMTDGEIEHFCEECYNEWYGIQPKPIKEVVIFS